MPNFHEKFLKKMGVDFSRRTKMSVIDFPDYSTYKPGVAPKSNMIGKGGGYKRDILVDHKWKKGAEESESTVQAIENKARRVAPAYNKGGYQLITDGISLEDIARKK